MSTSPLTHSTRLPRLLRLSPQLASLLTLLALMAVSYGCNLFLEQHHTHWQRLPWAVPAGLVMLGGVFFAAGALPGGGAKVLTLPAQRLGPHWGVALSWVACAALPLAMIWMSYQMVPGFYLLHALVIVPCAVLWLSYDPSQPVQASARCRLSGVLGAGLALYGTLVVMKVGWDRMYSLSAASFSPDHYDAMSFQVLKAWGAGVQAFGQAADLDGAVSVWQRVSLPTVNAILWPSSSEFVRLALNWGSVPAAVLAAAALLVWVVLYRWVGRVGRRHAAPWTLGVRALVVLHAGATLVCVLFSFGLLRRSLPLLPIMEYRVWGILHAGLLLGLLAAAWAGRKTRAAAGPSPVAGSVTGLRPVLAYALAVTLLAGGLIALKDSRLASHARWLEGSRPETRGEIRDAEGHVLAHSVLAYDLALTPLQFWHSPSGAIPPDERLHSALAPWPHLQAEVAERLRAWPRDRHQVSMLAYAVTAQQLQAVQRTGLSGIGHRSRFSRSYPEGSLFAHAVGYTLRDASMQGIDGLELGQNRHLEQPNAAPLVLTLRRSTQAVAREALLAGMKASDAAGGAVVVLSVPSGELLAMSSAPGYDPNQGSTFRSPYRPDAILNRALSATFPASGLVQPLMAARLLDEGRARADTVLDAVGDSGRPDAPLTLADSAVQASRAGHERMLQMLGEDGLRRLLAQTQLDDSQRTKGVWSVWQSYAPPLMSQTDWTPQQLTTSVDDLRFNLLQATSAYMPLATDGQMVLAHAAPGQVDQPSAGKARVFSPQTAHQLRQMLDVQAAPRHTSRGAAIPGTTVAGRSLAVSSHTWLDTRRNPPVTRQDPARNVFIGMFPADRPRYLVGVMLEFAPPVWSRVSLLSTHPMFSKLGRELLALEPRK